MLSTNTGTTHVYFNSVSLAIVSTVFMGIIVFMYLRKERVKSISTTLFFVTIALNILCILDFLLI